MSKPKRKYTCAQFEAAIPDSGGIMSTIAKRVGCAWTVADAFIRRHPSLLELYNAELESNLDIAESVILTNIRIAYDKQAKSVRNNKPETVDSTDAKWFVSKKGKGRGYSDKVELEHTGAGGGPIKTEDVTLTDEERAKRILAILDRARARADRQSDSPD